MSNNESGYTQQVSNDNMMINNGTPNSNQMRMLLPGQQSGTQQQNQQQPQQHWNQSQRMPNPAQQGIFLNIFKY